jgi:hypothetical protein
VKLTWIYAVSSFAFFVLTLIKFWQEQVLWATAINVVVVVAGFLYIVFLWRQRKAIPPEA